MPKTLDYRTRPVRPDLTREDVAFWLAWGVLFGLLCALVWGASAKQSTTYAPWHSAVPQSLLGLIELYNLGHTAPVDLEKYPNGDQLLGYTLADGSLTQSGLGALPGGTSGESGDRPIQLCCDTRRCSRIPGHRANGGLALLS